MWGAARDVVSPRSVGGALISDEFIAEAQAVLMRPAFDRYVSGENRITLLDLLIDEATLAPITVSIHPFITGGVIS